MLWNKIDIQSKDSNTFYQIYMIAFFKIPPKYSQFAKYEGFLLLSLKNFIFLIGFLKQAIGIGHKDKWCGGAFIHSENYFSIYLMKVWGKF